MLELERKGNEVFNKGCKLTIVAQASKGAGNEVVKITGLEGSNGQKWVSLSRLSEGLNTIDCKAREVVSTNSKKYQLTSEEQLEVDGYQAKIDAIIEKAKARYVVKPNLNFKIEELSDEQRIAKIEEISKYLESLK